MMDFNTITPLTTDALLKAMKETEGNNVRFGAGYTDLILELEMKKEPDLTVINLSQLVDDDFKSITKRESGITIGSLATMTDVLADTNLQQFPVLIEAVESVASVQIRSVATVGGNICTASPAGDVSCALVALNANCEIINSDGEVRSISLADFFTGVKTTVLKRNEILRNVVVPSAKSHSQTISGFVKIGNRNSMEIALASLAYHIHTDENGKVTSAGASIGSVAKTIMYCHSACEYLLGKSLSQLKDSEKDTFSKLGMENANPISDIRASAWYRHQVLENISKNIF